jgi:transposase
VGKRRVSQHPAEFRRAAVARVRSGESVKAVAKEIDIHWRLLYKWRDQDIAAEGTRQAGAEAEKAYRELRKQAEAEKAYRELGKQVQQLKQRLAEKALEVDFFKGALQKVEARRRQAGIAGEKASTSRSKR